VKAQALIAPFRFEMRDEPAPDPDALTEGQVLLRVLAGAVCGSDLPKFKGIVSGVPGDNGQFAANIPGFPMHEVVGEVVAAPGSDLVAGQRVVGWAENYDALAEYVVSLAVGLRPVDSAGDPAYQVMMQPLACVLHAVDRLGDLENKTAAVVGLGPIGLLFSHVLHTRGIAHVTGIDRVDRTDAASPFFIDEVVPSSSERWAREVGKSTRPDLVIDAVGHQVSTLNHEIEAVAVHGTIFYFGINDDSVYPMDMGKFLRKQLTLISGTTPHAFQRDALGDAERYLKEFPDLPRAYVSHVFSLDEAQAAYECANTPAAGRYKVAVRMVAAP
jgi:threonine dehydrogenase-like Zn-dependent dehydrogenase